MWQPTGGKVCEMGRLGARRGGTHLLCVCPSFPNPPDWEDGAGGAPPAFVISGAHRVPIPSWGPVVLEGDSEAGQAPPGSATLLQPAPHCAKKRFETSGQVSSPS